MGCRSRRHLLPSCSVAMKTYRVTGRYRGAVRSCPGRSTRTRHRARSACPRPAHRDAQPDSLSAARCTLQYEWFFKEDESETIVFERYPDTDAAVEHFANISHLMEPLMAPPPSWARSSAPERDDASAARRRQTPRGLLHASRRNAAREQPLLDEQRRVLRESAPLAVRSWSAISFFA